MDNPQAKRTLFIIASGIDAIISGIILLIYFGLFPVDISSWGIPRWALGLVGGVWFVASIAMLAYFLTKTDVSE